MYSKSYTVTILLKYKSAPTADILRASLYKSNNIFMPDYVES